METRLDNARDVVSLPQAIYVCVGRRFELPMKALPMEARRRGTRPRNSEPRQSRGNADAVPIHNRGSEIIGSYVGARDSIASKCSRGQSGFRNRGCRWRVIGSNRPSRAKRKHAGGQANNRRVEMSFRRRRLEEQMIGHVRRSFLLPPLRRRVVAKKASLTHLGGVNRTLAGRDV